MTRSPRETGRMLVRKERDAWVEAGWEVDILWPEARWRGRRIQSADRDLFHRYDMVAAHPASYQIALIQVTTQSPRQKGDPLFGMDGIYVVVKDPDMWMANPGNIGVGEVISIWRRLKRGRTRRAWTPRRVWWLKDWEKPE